MCTVVCRVEDGMVQILALRDEFTGRDFDDPDAWWPDQPGVIGGRDRAAGGSWCVSDVTSGCTALLVNRTERFAGSPSRGVLPLLAVARGEQWTDAIDHTTMASFNLVLATPDDVTVWVWDARELRRVELGAGTHLVTSPGIDADDPKTTRFAPEFATKPWRDVVAATEPSDADDALVVRREHDSRTYATVFGQSITARPGELQLAYSRTPWRSDTWQERR